MSASDQHSAADHRLHRPAANFDNLASVVFDDNPYLKDLVTGDAQHQTGESNDDHEARSQGNLHDGTSETQKTMVTYSGFAPQHASRQLPSVVSQRHAPASATHNNQSMTGNNILKDFEFTPQLTNNVMRPSMHATAQHAPRSSMDGSFERAPYQQNNVGGGQMAQLQHQDGGHTSLLQHGNLDSTPFQLNNVGNQTLPPQRKYGGLGSPPLQHSHANPMPHQQHNIGGQTAQPQNQYSRLTSPVPNGTVGLQSYPENRGVGQTREQQHQYGGPVPPIQNGSTNPSPYQQSPAVGPTSEPQRHHPSPTTPFRNVNVERQPQLPSGIPQSVPTPQSLSGMSEYASLPQNSAARYPPETKAEFIKLLSQQQHNTDRPQASHMHHSPATQSRVAHHVVQTPGYTASLGLVPQHSAVGVESHMRACTFGSASQSPNSTIKNSPDSIPSPTPNPQKRSFEQTSQQLRQGHAGRDEGTPKMKQARLDNKVVETPTKADGGKQENVRKTPTHNGRTLQNGKSVEDLSVEVVRKVRHIAFRLAHPPRDGFGGSKITRVWPRKVFPDDFKNDKRLIRAGSHLHTFGRERLNLSEALWKHLNEGDSKLRPEWPMKIEDRQIVRCDEEHSLKDHSPLGTVSVSCVDCPTRQTDDPSVPTQHMMCSACIRGHEDVFPDHPELLKLVRGAAWEKLCDDCMENCNDLKICTCQWAAPRCLDHRRKHLEGLLTRCQYGVQEGPELCIECFLQPVTEGIAWAWKCQICMGVFVMPNDETLTWLPSGPPLSNGLTTVSADDDNAVVNRLLKMADGGENSGEVDFDFSYASKE